MIFFTFEKKTAKQKLHIHFYCSLRFCTSLIQFLTTSQVGSLASSDADPKAVLAACDEVRDGALLDLGVRLEDKADGEG